MRGRGDETGLPDRLFQWGCPSRENVLRRLEASAAEPLSLENTDPSNPSGHRRLPGFARDVRSIGLGRDETAWLEAKDALRNWRMFDQSSLELIGGHVPPEPGRTVAILVPILGFCCVSLSRVVRVFDESDEALERYGFVYVTLAQHAVYGMERFEVRRNRGNGEVVFRIEAVSRPSRWYLWLGYPLTRLVQKRFGRGALAAMRRAVGRRQEYESGTGD